MNNMNLFDLIGGRKFGLSGGVVATLLTFVGAGLIVGDQVLWVLLAVVFLCCVYIVGNIFKANQEIDASANGYAKGIKATDADMKYDNIKKMVEEQDKKINMILARIPPAAGELPKE